jgi:CHAT domain-containing protein
MSSFYGALRDGDSCSTALARAQFAVLQIHPHPYFWAGFTLHGGW